jgi:polygalacturonase
MNLSDHGAIADGTTLCTNAFARAIDACANAGGGKVIVPRGTYLTGPIQLRSHAELHLERGATILFSRNYHDYPLVVTDWEGEDAVRCMSPIWGVELHDVAITGEGTFDGQGEAWRPVKKWKMPDEQWAKLVASGGAVDEEEIWWPTARAMNGAQVVERLRSTKSALDPQAYEEARDFLRPNMVKLTRCRGVTLDGPTFRNSAAWNVHLLLCENVTIRNVTILNPWYSTNGDALDLDSCRNVKLTHSHFDAGDDAICIKSGKDEAGRKRGVPCENIDISNCTVVRGHGGVTIGSEMSGGVRNLRVANCVFTNTDIGLRFKTTRGRGGVVENVDISNVAMSNIKHDAISLNMFYWTSNAPRPQPEPLSERTPVFRNFTFRNIICDGAARAIEMRGLTEMPIESIRLENVRIRATKGAILTDARNITIESSRIDAAEGPALQCHNVSNLKIDQLDAFSPPEEIRGKVGDL